jgi:translin
MLENLGSITELLRKTLTARDEAREKMLPLCRDCIRYCSNAIRAVHRQEFTEAKELLKTARETLAGAQKTVESYSELNNTGIIRDAQKEYAEANITLALVTGRTLPRPKTLGVDAAAYLNGMGESVGEIRRYLLDMMRQGDLSRGDELLTAMDEIYSVLVTMDFPDAISGGLRRTTDMVRGVLERTRSDLTLAVMQKALETKLAEIHPEILPPEKARQVEEEDVADDAHEDDPELDSIEMEIYEALTAWRDHRANEENLAPFIIARNSWLKHIIKRHPKSTKELYDIKGFGERRINKYGKDIIKIINKGK